MIERLTIEGYRGFKSFEMQGFGRINLLVGRNQAGKTSVLEAIRLLRTGLIAPAEIPGVLWAHALRRDEALANHVRLRHLFHLQPSKSHRSQNIVLRDEQAEIHLKLVHDHGPKLRLRCKSSRHLEAELERPRWHLADHDAMERPRDFELRSAEGWSIPPIAGPRQLSATEQSDLFGRLVLGPEEDRLVESLRLIDRRIQRLAATSGEQAQLVVRLEGVRERLPLGQLGGGVNRLLQLWLSLALAGDGPLLVDEIDIGLHHSVLIDMWRRIWQLIRERDIQVFATSHSWDSISALGVMCELDQIPPDEVTVHRVEPEKGQAIRYSAARIAVAAEHGIEVR